MFRKMRALAAVVIMFRVVTVGFVTLPQAACGFFGALGLVRGLSHSQPGASTRAHRVHRGAIGLAGDCSKRTPRAPHLSMATVPSCMHSVPGRMEGLVVSGLLISQKTGILAPYPPTMQETWV